MNANSGTQKSGISGWVWVGLSAGVVLLIAVVLLVIKSKKGDDEVVTERHTSEMVDQNAFQEMED